MIDVKEVEKSLIDVFGYSEETLKEREGLIENAVNFVEHAVKSYKKKDEQRLVFLTAARANFYLALIGEKEGGVTSFKAGDVSFTRGEGNDVELAKSFFDAAAQDCADLIKNNAFVFRSV